MLRSFVYRISSNIHFLVMYVLLSISSIFISNHRVLSNISSSCSSFIIEYFFFPQDVQRIIHGLILPYTTSCTNLLQGTYLKYSFQLGKPYWIDAYFILSTDRVYDSYIDWLLFINLAKIRNVLSFSHDLLGIFLSTNQRTYSYVSVGEIEVTCVYKRNIGTKVINSAS